MLETKYRKINPIEKPYFKWIKENMIASQVEIYFGDSGIGIFSDAYVNKYKKDKNNYETLSNLKMQDSR